MPRTLSCGDFDGGDFRHPSRAADPHAVFTQAAGVAHAAFADDAVVFADVLPIDWIVDVPEQESPRALDVIHRDYIVHAHTLGGAPVEDFLRVGEGDAINLDLGGAPDQIDQQPLRQFHGRAPIRRRIVPHRFHQSPLSVSDNSIEVAVPAKGAYLS